jgi:xanthine dehydrogenase accessory factor
MTTPLKILVRGSGDVASAAAHLLFRSGFAVVMHESPQPTATRRKMAFTDAVFDGSAWLEGLEGRRIDDLSVLLAALEARQFIPLSVADFALVLREAAPAVLVDARMRKHSQPETQRGLAPLTLGLGPGFEAGQTVDVAIETGRGPDLGRVIRSGAAAPLWGEPVALAGHARDRYVYAPLEGIFRTGMQVGDQVRRGQVVAEINGQPLTAPLDGVLRGLTRDGVPVAFKTKVIEVDPRGQDAQVSGIAERPAKIAQGVLQAVQAFAHGVE